MRGGAGEFELIRRFTAAFRSPPPPFGPGDDCAVLPASKEDLCVTTDALVEGVHFTRRHFTLQDVGHKALAVNLSDLAAMGATPAWFVCALGLPKGSSERDVVALARGMAALARKERVTLVGGNFTRARELSVTLTAAGHAPRGKEMLRSGGKAGDFLYVSGTLGDARLGLACLGTRRAPRAQARQRRPMPRTALALAARGVASACIDISDGFAADLGHLCEASRVGAEVEVTSLPVSRELRALKGRDAWRWALAGGEDYELLLAVSSECVPELEAAFPVTQVGRLTSGRGVRFFSGGSRVRAPQGWDHFAR